MILSELIFRKKRGFDRIRSVFPYILSRFYCDRLRQVDIELSNRCNLRCRMCWFHGENGVGDRYKGDELATHEVFSILDHLAHYNPDIYIGGSEPFIRKDFLMIVNHIKRLNMRVSFTTNGTLLDVNKIKKLVEFGVDVINFSIDGNEELHDKIRGRGVYEKVTQSVKTLAEYKKKEASKKPVIWVNITITSDLNSRLKEMLDAIRYSTGDGADFYRLHHLWYITQNELSVHQSTIKQKLGCVGTGAASHVLPLSLVPDPIALAEEIMHLSSLTKVKMFPDLQYADLVKYYSERPKLRMRCIAPFFGAVIKPNGDVKFCPDEWIDDYILGNLRNTNFHDIWNNERSRRFRAVLTKERRFAGCNRCSWMYSYG